MAFVKRLKHQIKERNSVHSEVVATYSVFDVPDHGRFFQIDTFGSSDRQIPGKTSQSLQIDQAGAEMLIALLKSEFKLT